jgi:hypothetical protein
MSNELNNNIFANITSLQMFEPNNNQLELYFSELNMIRKLKRKPIFSFKPVNLKLFIIKKLKYIILFNYILEYWYIYL